MAKKIDLCWGSGETELFLAPYKGAVEVLDYEFDTHRIHEICGGKCYYKSCSGCSGAGYIEKMEDLTRVGYYRVDTVHNEFQYHIEVAEGIKLLLPYKSHERNKYSTLMNNPVVIIIGNSTIIYCNFYENMNDVLATILSGKELKQEPRILKRTFVDTKAYCKKSEVVELKFYNLFGGYSSHYPWEFVKGILRDYKIISPQERIHNIFRLSKCEDGTVVKTSRIAQTMYATEILVADPCEHLLEPFPGWELAETNMLYKVRENEVYIVGWELCENAYGKKVERIARFIPTSEAAEFKSFVKGHLPSTKYVEYESTVPKLLFFLNKEEQIADIRKGIAKKVREDVLSAAKQFVNDKQILDAIPEELIITLEDSYSSGII